MWEDFDCFYHSLREILGGIKYVALLVLWVRDKVPVFQYMLGKVVLVTWTLKNIYFGYGRCKQGFIKTKGSV